MQKLYDFGACFFVRVYVYVPLKMAVNVMGRLRNLRRLNFPPNPQPKHPKLLLPETVEPSPERMMKKSDDRKDNSLRNHETFGCHFFDGTNRGKDDSSE